MIDAASQARALSASTRLNAAIRDDPDAATAAIHHDNSLKQKDRANLVEMLEETQQARDINTKRAYEPKQVEFITWATQRGYRDHNTVTEEKLISFLKDEVVNRPLRRRKNKALVAHEVDLKGQWLSYRSIRSYVTAMTDLYNNQKTRGMNSNPSPRDSAIQNYVKSLQRRDADQARKNFADRGRGTYHDGFSEEQLKKLCGGSSSSYGCYLRTIVDTLLGYYMLAKGQDRCNAELTDVHTFNFAAESTTSASIH
jgi:Centromere DNA-binding protein complex CBF3 subunit, domain 2